MSKRQEKQAEILNSKKQAQALAECKDANERARILLSLKCGLRAMEIAGLQWDRIDLDERTIRLNKTKNGTPRTVYIGKDLLDALMTLSEARRGDLVFTSKHSAKGSKITANAMQKWFRYFYLKRCGFDKGDFSSHSGRRTFITEAARDAVKAGFSLKDVMEMAGHGDLSVTKRYIETDAEAQKLWMMNR